jgi:hypothetical protein
MARFNLNDYRAYIRISHNKRMLVEGKGDKRFFIDLLDALFTKYKQPITRDQIEIDTAEELIGEGFQTTRGNREKVEYVCNSVIGTSDADKLVGFVDREFREFDWRDEFLDRINGHRVVGRLVWSRGHSVENYFFEMRYLSDSLSAFSVNDRFKEALRRFHAIFESVLRSACAASIAGLELNKLSLIKRGIDWNLVDLSTEKMSIKITDWKAALITHQGLQEPQAQELIDRYQFWLERVEAASFQVVRWLCHGHTGFAFIWLAYAHCMYEVYGDFEDRERQYEARRVLGADEKVRANLCLNIWSKRAVDDDNYPRAAFTLLGLTTHTAS